MKRLSYLLNQEFSTRERERFEVTLINRKRPVLVKATVLWVLPALEAPACSVRPRILERLAAVVVVVQVVVAWAEITAALKSVEAAIRAAALREPVATSGETALEVLSTAVVIGFATVTLSREKLSAGASPGIMGIAKETRIALLGRSVQTASALQIFVIATLMVTAQRAIFAAVVFVFLT